MRSRLRQPYTDAELAGLYPRPHEHSRWPDHRLRVDVTVQIGRFLHRDGLPVADLSCGDARIAQEIGGAADLYLGDLASGYRFHGPIEQTIDQIPQVDLFVCCETLEHLNDPDLVLRKIRGKSRALVVSTPDGETTDENPEHYWGWDQEDVGRMLHEAGFVARVRSSLVLPQFKVAYQIWGCE